MKFHYLNSRIPAGTRLVFLDRGNMPDIIPDDADHLEGGNLSLFKSVSGGEKMNLTPIGGRIENASGSLPAETAAHISEQARQVIDQSSETTIQKSFSGNRLARRFTPERFSGFNFNLYDLRFWFGASWLNPKQVILNQTKEAFADVGDPANLVEGSPLVSDQVFRSLVNSQVLNKAISAVENSGSSNRGINQISLSSLELLKSTLEDRQKRIQKINAEQINDFTAKADDEVWWKQIIRKPVFQRALYNQKIKVIKRRNEAGHNELMAILDGIIQTKEQNVFTARQNTDQVFIMAENAGGSKVPSIGMTGIELGHAARETIHLILSQPEAFVKNPSSCAGRVPLDFLFGKNFVPLDVLEALQTTKYEKFGGLNVNYVDSSIGVNQWEMSHYNALRTLDGLKQRQARLDQFQKARFSHIEDLVNKVYEPAEGAVNVNNPAGVVSMVKTALESATPGLRQKVTNLLQSNLYASATEQFWVFTKFFNDHPMTFKALPPKVQQAYAAFFIQKRDSLEQALVSGANTENASALWRSQALVRGQDVLSKVKDVANELPELGTHLLSRDKGVAQASLQKFQSLIDAYQFFVDLVGEPQEGDEEGENAKKQLLDDLPELERGLLDNVFLMRDYVTQVEGTLSSLREKRAEFEQLLDVDPELVERQRQFMEEEQKTIKSTGSGLDDIRVPVAGFAGGGGISGGEGDDTVTGRTGGGLEPKFTVVQREVKELRDTLMGPGGDANKGQISAAQKITGFTFPVPGQIQDTLLETADLGEKLIASRVKELGVQDADSILKNRPTFDDLARLEMSEIVSREIVRTGKTFLQNETSQQFERMLKNKETPVRMPELRVADMTFQTDLTVQSLLDPIIFKDVRYARQAEDGSLWYQTKTEAIKILKPRIGSKDARNVLIWEKDKSEHGFGQFTTPPGNPDRLGTMLTGRPENSAFARNDLYGLSAKKIKRMRS